MKLDKWLLPTLVVMIIGAGLIVTSKQPVYKGGPKHVYPISELKEYAGYGRGVYIQTSPITAMYVFYKQCFGGLPSGTYRFTFTIETQNFDTLPYVEFLLSFDGMNATMGATLEPTLHSASGVTYTFDKFEVLPSPPQPGAPFSISHIIEFPLSETKGIVTFNVDIEKYETNLRQLVAGITLIVIGAATGVLRLKKLFKKRPAEPLTAAKISFLFLSLFALTY